MRKSRGGIRSGRGNFDLRRRLDTSEFGRLVVAEPTAAEEEENAKGEKTHYERQEGIAARRLGGRPGDAGDIRHVRPKTGGWSIVGHRNKMIVLVMWQREQLKFRVFKGGRESVRKGQLC